MKVRVETDIYFNFQSLLTFGDVRGGKIESNGIWAYMFYKVSYTHTICWGVQRMV